MKQQPEPIEINTSLGIALATPGEIATTGQREWAIGYPWGDERFFGEPDEVKARMRENVRRNDR